MTRQNAIPTPVVPYAAALISSEMIEPPPSTRRLGARDLASALAAMKVDDEPTLDVPAPLLPAGIPSPVGDDVLDETLTLSDLGIERDDDFPLLEHPSRAANRRALSTERDVKRLVIAIWTVVIAMAAIFTYVIMKEESSRANKEPSSLTHR